MSSQRELEEKLEECTVRLARANQELEQFIHTVSHDLKEPLYTISMYTGLLLDKYEGRLDPEVKQMMGVLTQMSQQSMRMVDALVKYSRVRTKDFMPQACDCEKIVENLSGNFKRAQITRAPLPSLQGDPAQLTLLFQALFENAAQFNKKEKAEIHVSAEKNDGLWLFAVRDNGIGIEKKFLERIFQAFQRLHPQTEYPGAGIGLAISKVVVENHGGKIWAESEPGQGSVFYFTIPQK